MVLLRGLNYDYSGQQSSYLTEVVEPNNTILNLQNTKGFVENDYIIIAPNTEETEIVKIDAAVTSNGKITISALKFNHGINTKVYRTNYNQMKFYECATISGTYTVIASSTTNMSYINNYTNYDYASATAEYYYKRTFYNEETSTESPIDLSESWQVDDENLYVTTEEMRMFLQFDINDFPTPNDMRFFIKIGMTNVGLDMDTSSVNILFIATLLRSKELIMRALASKALSKGYIQVNAEGRTITKAYQELILDAENTLQEYKEFILRNGRREATSTNFMDDSTVVDTWTRSDIINIMNGTTDAQDFQDYYSFRRK